MPPWECMMYWHQYFEDQICNPLHKNKSVALHLKGAIPVFFNICSICVRYLFDKSSINLRFIKSNK